MELTYLIENYSYLKFIVDVYEEYSKEHEISDDIWFRKITRKYEEAKTFLSFIILCSLYPLKLVQKKNAPEDLSSATFESQYFYS